MKAGWASCCCLSAVISSHQLRAAQELFVTEGTQYLCIISPAAFHFHPDLKIYFAAETFFHILSGCGGDQLELISLLADHDGFLIGFIYNDGGMNLPQFAFGREFIDNNTGGIGELFAE